MRKDNNISTDGLNFTPEKARWNEKEIVGCSEHPNSTLTATDTDMGVVVICVPSSNKGAHILYSTSQ